ncbi:MAG: hypothetical protein QG614_446 [Patescibacteria group bacterium]|nr:hypothetical protein [Patescibacteria group bacterium]
MEIFEFLINLIFNHWGIVVMAVGVGATITTIFLIMVSLPLYFLANKTMEAK